MDKSTPRPWGQRRHQIIADGVVIGEFDPLLAGSHNAALCSRAVNRDAAFDALVEALRELLLVAVWDETEGDRVMFEQAEAKARAALALAKETP